MGNPLRVKEKKKKEAGKRRKERVGRRRRTKRKQGNWVRQGSRKAQKQGDLLVKQVQE